MSENNIKCYSVEELLEQKGQTDWKRVREAGDHDEPAEIDIDWDSARIVEPRSKKMVSLRLDPDILEFFRSGGPGYQTRINAVLRSYMRAKKGT